MVRLKTRYILFDVIYPDAAKNSYKTRSESLISLHQSSPSTINTKILMNLLKNTIQEYFGDYGSGITGSSLNLKYFSNKTSTGIIRVTRNEYRVVCAALALINKIDGCNVVVRVIRVSGTIKKCENFAITRNKKMISQVSNDVFDRFDDKDMMKVSDDVEKMD